MMLLGIEIGGTKLQLGVGRGDGSPLVEIRRLTVDPSRGAEAVLRQIALAGKPLVDCHKVTAVGIGFGGPVDASAGRTLKSHQVAGWDDFPLRSWCREQLGLPAAIVNDTDAAGLAESRFGAGRGKKIVFYVTVGSGVGGALVIDGDIYCDGRRVSAEIGHLRPGLRCEGSEATVESLASGWGIAAAARAALAGLTDPKGKGDDNTDRQAATDLLERCDGRVERLTTQLLAQAAIQGNELARQVFQRACQALGWAIAQAITLLAPDVVVVGGGVSLSGDALFFAPLLREVHRYVFPPLAGSFVIRPAALGEEVVVHGALAVAASCRH
jgi:glucokinase